jgi:hypothetical protein
MSLPESLLVHRILTHEKIVHIAKHHKTEFERTGNTYIFPSQNLKVQVAGGWSMFNKNWTMSTFLPSKELNGVPLS